MDQRSPRHADTDKVIAIGLLTQRDIDALGSDFRRVYPVDDMPCFGDLLRSIDEADRKMARRAAGGD